MSAEEKPVSSYRDEDPIYIQSAIYETARKIASLNVDSFYKKYGSSEVNELTGFEKEKPSIEYVIQIADFITTVQQKEAIKLSRNILKSLRDGLNNLESLLREMRNFHEKGIPDGSFETEKKVLVKSEKDNLLGKFHENLSVMQIAVTNLVNIVNTDKIESIGEQLNKLVDAQTNKGIEKHHTLYSTNANSHFFASGFWIFISVFLAWFAWQFGVSTLNRIELLEKASTGQGAHMLVEIVLIRIFLFGFLASILFWCLRNYRLNKHNQLINEQKALALQTFSEFANAASTDQDMRRAVLGKVTATIFEIPNMGYINANNKADFQESGIVSSLTDLLSRKPPA